MSDYDNIQNALNHIDPQDRETWFRMGAAIKDELGENGFEMWDNWSRQADNYKQTDAQSVWKSIKTGHIHIATLFKVARENGYRPERPYTPPSPETLAQRAQIAQEKQRAEAERITQAHAKAEKTAYGIWQNASPADPKHAYAQNKGLGLSEAAMSVLRQNEYNGKKQLIIPLYSDKKLVNVQTIDEDGNKKFLNGGQKQGAYTIIGDFKQNQQGIILAEGFATAASVHEATGKPVVVAFDAGNLKAVSEKLLNVLPENVPVYFAADNDPSQTGLHKAQAAAEVWGERAQILLPEFSDKQIAEFQEKFGENKIPTDFNDLHKLAGIDAVRERFDGLAMAQESEIEADTDFRQPEMEHVKPELSREELLKNNYWRVANGYDPLPEYERKTEPQTELPNETNQAATSEKDVAVSISEKENSMENQKSYSHDNPYAEWAAHDDEVRQNADDWEARQPLTDSRLADFNSMAKQQGFTTHIESQHGGLGTFQADKYLENSDYHVEILGQFKNHGSQAIYEAARDFTVSFHEKGEIVDYLYTNDLNTALQQSNEWLKNHELQQGQHVVSEQLFSQSENERTPDFYDYNFEDLPKERPQVAQNQQEAQTPEPETTPADFRQPEPETATSENDVAVSVSETNQAEQETPSEKIGQPERPNLEPDEPEQEMHNTIEYEAFQREIDPAEPEKTEFRQPENPSVAQTPPTTELETEESKQEKNEPERPAPEQEKSQANTGLDYTIPAHLQSRMIAVDAQRFRVANYEMGAHLLRYTAPDNPQTVLFEDKGKTIQTARDDKQTIQDMLDVAKAKGWDSIKISGSQEFKQQMWLEAESRGIATKGYKPSPEDLAILERRREERATNSIAEAEKLKQQSATPERPESTMKTIPTEAVKAADTVKAHAAQAQQTNTPKPSDTAKAQYESKLATLPTEQQHKARFYERQALAAMRHMPAEFHEKTRQAIYENQTDLIRNGKYHAPDPAKTQDRQPEKAQEKAHERVPSRDDWEMER
ncbi:LPD7 domain-containing protein [Alysiella crassa]|uniref:DNA primase TraC n=1 Tax=Alysiella crassa TaxID=153491 RepID=A0A376BLX1_9NEIS|nr:LPD7 domain-containing protein [Alysiella crassa]UOP07157.1 PriCT-2 domain-containing protein [Alysiella crassa]SSY70681.1 DNA primase TraC [Alysiella crassa]